jgi:hypothetical protein
VTDCAQTPIPGATISVKQGGVDVPNTSPFDVGALGGAMFEGTYAVFNIPPGETEIGATVNGQTLAPRTITMFADQSSATQLRPGFPN